MNESESFPKHFTISRAVAEKCLDYLNEELKVLKLENRDWIPLAISIACAFKDCVGIDIYKKKLQDIKEVFASETRINESKRDIVTLSSMPDEKLSLILEIAISELSPLEFINNQKHSVETLENLCELGFVILRDIWQSPSYIGVEAFSHALESIADGNIDKVSLNLAWEN